MSVRALHDLPSKSKCRCDIHGVFMKPSFRQKFQYRFDNLMSRGTPAMVGMLFLLSLVIVFIAGGIITIAGFVQEGETARLSFGEAAWESLMRTLDSGTMGGDTGA